MCMYERESERRESLRVCAYMYESEREREKVCVCVCLCVYTDLRNFVVNNFSCSFNFLVL